MLSFLTWITQLGPPFQYHLAIGFGFAVFSFVLMELTFVILFMESKQEARKRKLVVDEEDTDDHHTNVVVWFSLNQIGIQKTSVARVDLTATKTRWSLWQYSRVNALLEAESPKTPHNAYCMVSNQNHNQGCLRRRFAWVISEQIHAVNTHLLTWIDSKIKWRQTIFYPQQALQMPLWSLSVTYMYKFSGLHSPNCPS